MTGVEGHVGVVGQSSGVDTTVTDTSDGSSITTSSKQTDLRFETALMTHSYIYHPNFLKLDVGLGVVGSNGHSDSGGFSITERQKLYNLSAHAMLLADKPVHGTAFYDRLNSTPTVDLGEIFNQQNTRYGFTVSAQAPVVPVGLDFGMSREESQGNSAVRMASDKTDRATFSARRSLPNNGLTRFNYDVTQQESSSSTSTLALQNSVQQRRTASLDTRLPLGSGSAQELYNRIEYSTQTFTRDLGSTPKTDDLRFTLGYSGFISPQLRTYANYQFGRNRQDDLSLLTDSTVLLTDSTALRAIWTVQKDLDVGAGVFSDDAKSPQFSTHSRGVDGSVNYNRKLPVGSGQLGYSVRYDQRDQVTSGSAVSVIGERIVLTGTLPVTLARTLITPGSVQVFNATRTQTYVEGFDYILTVIGITTRIERVLSGNILDGEELLLDYSFDAGGTYANTQLDQSLNLNWAVSQMLNVYARFSDSSPKLVSGTPTAPLNTVKSRLFGARGEFPVASRFDFVVGGLVEQENRVETISPYVRTSAELFMQGDLPSEVRTNYRLGTRRQRVTADNQLQDSNLVSYDLLVGMRFDTGLSLNAIGLFERDDGGATPRDRKSATLKAFWRYRRVSLTADLSRIQESQGRYASNRTMGRFDLRRDF